MQYWQEVIGAQLVVSAQSIKPVFSIFFTGHSLPNNAYKNLTNTNNDMPNLQVFKGFITPPRKITDNSGPPPLKKIRRFKDNIIPMILDPSSPDYQEYSPPPTPSRAPLKPRNTSTALGQSHPNETILNNPHDSLTQFTQSRNDSIHDDSNKENVEPLCLKQEPQIDAPQRAFKVMAVNARSIITDDKPVGNDRMISKLSQNSWSTQTDKTRENASMQFRKGINTVHEMYLSTRETGKTLTTPAMTNPVGASHSEPALHPHVDISSSNLLRNPLVNVELRPMSLSIISPNARVTEFCHNSNLQDSFFAKIYLPYASLT